jgi:hypothetical protein
MIQDKDKIRCPDVAIGCRCVVLFHSGNGNVDLISGYIVSALQGSSGGSETKGRSIWYCFKLCCFY